ncbi:MAG TPA: tetratricopeptide repeat protein [Armatimonadota bacterium]|nr:tetratricopeptide repeat protein [Armatimonadota bacterium]
MSDNSDDLFRTANACSKSGKHEESASLYRQYVDLRPRSPGGWRGLAYSLLALSDWDGAVAALKEALRLKPDYADARVLYAFALERKGEVAAAIAQYRAGIATDLVDVRAFEYLARLHLGRGELKEADRVAREGRRSWPKALVMRRVLADILVKRKRWREAGAEYEAIAAKCPDDPGLACMLGWVRERAGDLQGAKAGYERALVLCPDRPETLVSLGRVLWNLNELDEAEAAYRQAIELSPRHVSSRIWLAGLLCRRWRVSRSEGDLQAARREIDWALALAPNADAAVLTLAHIEWKAGNRQRSLQILENGAQMHPGLPDYHFLLALWSLRQRKLRRAWAAWREFRRFPRAELRPYAAWGALPPAPSEECGAGSPATVESAHDVPGSDPS